MPVSWCDFALRKIYNSEFVGLSYISLDLQVVHSEIFYFLRRYPAIYAMIFSRRDGDGFITLIFSSPTKLSLSGCCPRTGSMSEPVVVASGAVLAMLLRLRRTLSTSAAQLDPFEGSNNWSNTTCLKATLNSRGSGLSWCLPLRRIIENKFSMQSWFKRLVN